MKRFKAYNGNSVIVCLALPQFEAGVLHAVTQLLNPNVELEDVEDLHITLAYLGEAEDLSERKNEILQTVLDFARESQVVTGRINGGGMFANGEDGRPAWAFYESQDVYLSRQRLVSRLLTNGFGVSRPYGFIPHITMAYLDGNTPFTLQFPSWPIAFTNLSVWWAGERYNFPLINPEPTEEKEVSSTPITSYGRGPDGLFSHPGLEEEAEKKAREKLPQGTDEKIVKLWKEAYIKKQNNEQSALYVFKDVNGRYRWLSISSTAFKDKDGEIIPRVELQKATEKMQFKGNYGPLRFWHTEGLELGTCDFSGVVSRSLIESGAFANERIGRSVSEKSTAYKMSIGFNYERLDSEGVYHGVDIFERSLVPADLAANMFTGLFVSKSEVKTMNSEKEQAVLSALKNLLPEQDYNNLLGQVRFREKSADNMNVQYKEADLTKLSPPELLAYAQKAVQEYEQEQEAHKEITAVVEKAVETKMGEYAKEMKAMMDRMGAMMNRMNSGDDDKEEKTKAAGDGAIGGGRVGDGGNPLQEKLNEAEKQIQSLTAQLQTVTKSVQDMANAAPRRATTTDDNVITTVKEAALNGGQLVEASQLGNGGQNFKDNYNNFMQFLAGGV